MLADTLREMAGDGVRRALAFVTSAYSSWSGCRQYLGDIERARAEVGEAAPRIDKLRVFYNHPGFVEPLAELVDAAFERIPEARRRDARLVFTAHSLPRSLASTSDYEAQLRETAGLVAFALGRPDWSLVYQSRSGPPSQPWLEPDIVDHLRALAAEGARDAVVAPIGFISDHMEVVYDLDLEARSRSVEVGLNMIRAATVGTHPRFVRMIRELVEERLTDDPARLALGTRGPAADVCPPDCCPAATRPEGSPPAASVAPRPRGPERRAMTRDGSPVEGRGTPSAPLHRLPRLHRGAAAAPGARAQARRPGGVPGAGEVPGHRGGGGGAAGVGSPPRAGPHRARRRRHHRPGARHPGEGRPRAAPLPGRGLPPGGGLRSRGAPRRGPARSTSRARRTSWSSSTRPPASSGCTTSPPPTSPAPPAARSARRTSTWARGSRTTTRRPSSRPRWRWCARRSRGPSTGPGSSSATRGPARPGSSTAPTSCCG